MKLTFLLVAAIMSAPVVWAQAEQQEVKHHGMMHAMEAEHPISKSAKLAISDNAAAHAMTVRIGPIDLPAHADHMTLAQPPTLWLTIPFDGWLTAYHPSLVDATEHALPNKLLYDVAFYDTAQAEFLCPNKEEHIFGAGREMNDWPAIPGFGYRVHKGDRVRINTIFENPTSKNYGQVFLQVRIEYELANGRVQKLSDVYPAWFDVMGCGDSAYDLSPGVSTKTGQFKLRYSGKLIGVSGHLHDYGQWLLLKNAHSDETIATLEATLDSSGRIVSMPVKLFADPGGAPLHGGDVIEVTDAYINPTGKSLSGAAMGIVIGYFVPDQESPLTASRPTAGRSPNR